MSIVLRIAVFAAGILLLRSVLRDVITRKLREKQSLIWLFTCFGLVVVSIFPGTAQLVANIFGVDYTPSIIFAMVLIVTIFGLYRSYQAINALEKKVDELARQVSLLNAESVETEAVLKMVKIENEKDPVRN